MTQLSPEIYAFLATQGYLESPGRRGWEMGKFIVMFNDPAGELSPRDIESIVVSGPDDYSFAIRASEKYSQITLNGFFETDEPGVVRHRGKHLWYMAFDKSGFLKDGLYKVTVVYSDQTIRTRTNELRYDPSLLAEYLKYRAEMSFDAAVSLRGNDRRGLQTRWTTLKALANIDAYYCVRVGQRGLLPSINHETTIFTDDILNQSHTDETAGLNRESVELELDDLGSEYIWFVEVLDSNRIEDINIAIFGTTHAFSTKSIQGATS